MEDNMIYLFAGAVALCGVIQIFFLFKNGKKYEIFQLVSALVCEAEQKFGSGTGELKYEYVVNKVYQALPWHIRTFISANLLDDFIETAVDNLKAYLNSVTH